VAGEGGFILSIVNQLHCEDEEVAHLNDEDEDDRDDEPMPQEGMCWGPLPGVPHVWA
jgi:hypothetical protein